MKVFDNLEQFNIFTSDGSLMKSGEVYLIKSGDTYNVRYQTNNVDGKTDTEVVPVNIFPKDLDGEDEFPITENGIYDINDEGLIPEGFGGFGPIINVRVPQNYEAAYKQMIQGGYNTLNIPDDVTQIGEYAFYGRSLSNANVVIPEQIQCIDNYAFAHSGLKTLKLNEITQDYDYMVHNYAFSDCYNLTTVEVTSGKKYVDDSGGYEPTGYKSFGTYAFANCTKLNRVVFDGDFFVIEDHCFENCTALESCNVKNVVDTIFWYAFSGCTKLKTLNFNEDLQCLGSRAFYNCTGLTSVNFYRTDDVVNVLPNEPEGEEEPGDPFEGCTNLTAIYVPASLVETYKETPGWSIRADIIQALPTE